MAPNFATRIVEIRGDTVHFDEEIHFPTHPMVGVIGTAPEGEGGSEEADSMPDPPAALDDVD